jgi:N-hydroxyarylamine O-acetyltransferase
MPVRSKTVTAVLEKLGVERPQADLDGLRTVYGAWCGAVSFDNTLKLIHLAEGRPGPLPGSTADDFFEAWLEYGTGGTCWSGNGALHDLLEALGFDVARAIATMLPTPDVRGPNHGSVVVTVDDERWIVDASILTGTPIRIPSSGERAGPAGPLPRFEWLGEQPAVVWRVPRAPGGFPCRIDRIGAGAGEFDVLHQRTRAWSLFNYELNARVLRGATCVGVASGQRFAFEPDGSWSTHELDADGRVQFLVEELGISEAIARRVPGDLPTPPRPDVA